MSENSHGTDLTTYVFIIHQSVLA